MPLNAPLENGREVRDDRSAFPRLIVSHCFTEAERRAQSGLVDFARRYLRARRSRDALFGRHLFADPAWDLLLDLFVTGRDGRSLDVTAACYATAVPQTTALRWLRIMEREGLIRRDPDPNDKRRCYVGLTSLSEQQVVDWLKQMTQPET